MIKKQAQYKIEFPTWDSLSKEQKDIIKDGMGRAKSWFIQSLTQGYSHTPIATEMSIEFDDQNDADYCYIIPVSDDQEPHWTYNPFESEYDEEKNEYVYVNLRKLNVTKVNTHLYRQSKLPEYEDDGGYGYGDDTPTVEVESVEICPVIVTLIIDGEENTNSDLVPVFKYSDDYYATEHSESVPLQKKKGNVYDDEKTCLTDLSLDRLNKFDTLHSIGSFYGSDIYVGDEASKNAIKDVYIKVKDTSPEGLDVPYSTNWIKVHPSLYSFHESDGEWYLDFVSNIADIYDIEDSYENLSIVYDLGNGYKELCGITEVTGVLTIDQSPWTIPESNMDLNRGNDPRCCKNVVLGYNELKFTKQQRTPSGEWRDNTVIQYSEKYDSYSYTGFKFFIDGKQYYILSLKDFDEENNSYDINSDDISDLTIVNKIVPNTIVTAYCYVDGEIEDYEKDIIKLNVNRSYYDDNGTDPKISRQINFTSDSEKSEQFKYQLYTSSVTTDESTKFTPDSTKIYWPMNCNASGVPTKTNDLVGLQSYMPSEPSIYNSKECREILEDGRVFLGNSGDSSKSYNFVYWFKVYDKENFDNLINE